MNRLLRPFDIFHQPSVCVWLNGDPLAIGKKGEKIWNDSPIRVAVDGGINEINRRRVRWPTVACGDFDSIDQGIDLKGLERVEMKDQMNTDMAKVIQWLGEENRMLTHDHITILGGLNGRFDHTMSTLSTLVRFHKDARYTVTVFDGINLVFAVPEGSSKIRVDLELTTKMCGVTPIAQKPTIVTSKGLKYEMDKLSLEFGGIISSSNEVTTEEISLTTTAPVIFTIELKKSVVNALH